MYLKHFLPIFCAAFLGSTCLFASKPNVIVIMADDMGYGDVGCYGAKPKNLKTPHIDRLAKEGLRFTSGYCSASTCTPTRYSFLTGNYAFRRKGTGIAPPNGPSIIQPGETTIGDLLKKAGYKTAVIGKWHLGLGAPGKGPDWNGQLKPGPREIGFDYNFLLPTTNDRVPQVYVENDRVLNLDPKDPLWVGHKKPTPDHPTGISLRNTLKMDWSHGHNGTIHNGISRIGFYTGGHAARFRDEDLADKWVEKSEEWIKENKDSPFFLFFASHDLHVPRIPHERFQGKSALSYRGDAIVQMDWCVGEIVRILKEQKLEENTMVVFCSDNGPVGDDGYKDGALEYMGDHKSAGPYKGGKYSIFEGGTRTPFITWWPGKIKPGVSDEIVCTIDLATSLVSQAGVSIPEEAFVDSQNIIGALIGEKGAKGREHLIQQDNGGRGNFGFRKGNWKLLRHAKKMARNVKVEETLANTNVEKLTLINLVDDPGESKNLAKSNIDLVEKLNAELQTILDAGRSRETDSVSQ